MKNFGKDESIVHLAKRLITSDARSAARELNRIVNVMGESVTCEQVTAVLRKKHPEVLDPELRTLFHLARHNNLHGNDQLRLLNLLGVAKVDIKHHLWRGVTTYCFTWIDGTKQHLNEGEDLSRFIHMHVLPLHEK